MNYIIVEDELNHAAMLQILMEKTFPQYRLAAIATTIETAKENIRLHQPTFILLDVNLGNQNGFDLLEEIEEVQTGVIVVTAEPKYIHDALKARAHEFLVKPISSSKLREAVTHTLRIIERENTIPKVKLQTPEIYSKVNMPMVVKNKILLPEESKTWLVEIDEIIYVKAVRNQSSFHLTQKEKLKLRLPNSFTIVSYTLGKIEELLSAHQFLRIHDSYLINLNKVVALGRSFSSAYLLECSDNFNITKNKEHFFTAMKEKGIAIK